MAALDNARHERFAQELAKGKSQTEAYVAAGYKDNRSAASRLAEDVNVCERVAELQERGAIKAEVTIASLTARLFRLADVAEKTGIVRDEMGEPTASNSKHLGVSRAALVDIAKLNGLVVDKAQVDASVQVTEIRRTIVRA